MKSSGKMPLRLEEPIISLKSPSSSVNVNGLDGSNGTLHGAAYCGGHLLEHFWAENAMMNNDLPLSDQGAGQ